jgi:two-component system, LuxR family, response regulator FixJ
MSTEAVAPKAIAPRPIVHVIDDDEAARDSLGFLLQAADLSVKTYESALHFLDELPGPGAGCVVTDVRMPQMSGLELVRNLNSRGFGLPIIVITGHGDVPLAIEAMREGVVDFIEKPFEDDLILKALHAALARDRDQLERAAQRSLVAHRLASLSMRERQVLNGLMDGHANKVVAQDLGISPRTVEVYRANLMSKMQAGSLSELVRMALLAEERP